MRTPDFFERQHAAKRRTRLLLVLYALVIALLIGITYAVLVYVGIHIETIESGEHKTYYIHHERQLWQPSLLLKISLVILLIVLGGSFVKWLGLRRGGLAVAESLGGRPVSPDTQDPAERVLINVVEEMSIASGVPTPVVYLLDHEDGINAFAAGLGFEDATIGMTRGALTYCTRDELQGIVAHEYSHILHGDMRLNMRMISVLYGILMFYLLGRLALELGMRAASRGSRGRNNGSAALIIAGGGAAIALLGWLGVIGARIIKSAISRQREFLADAAAVQFTRYPDGIANALLKIGLNRSAIRDSHAEELSHMFFCNAVGSSWFSLFATHPPILQRVELLAPQLLEGKLEEYELRPIDYGQRVEESQQRQSTTEGLERIIPAGMGGAATAAIVLGALGSNAPESSTIGRMGAAAAQSTHNTEKDSPKQQSPRRDFLQEIPSYLRDLSHSAWGACALVIALLATREEVVFRQKSSEVDSILGQGGMKEVLKLADSIAKLPRPLPLMLVELAAQSLWNLPKAKQVALLSFFREVIEADGKIDLFELCLESYLMRALPEARPERSLFQGPSSLTTMGQLLRLQSNVSELSPERATRALSDLPKALQAYRATTTLSIDSLRLALREARNLATGEKELLTRALIHLVFEDAEVSEVEYEALRSLLFACGVPFPADLEIPALSQS